MTGQSIDTHTHLAPVLAPELGIEVRDGRYVLDDHEVGPAALYDPGALVTHLAANELDRAVTSIPPPFFRQGMGADKCRSWVGAANDGLLAAVEAQHALLPLAYLPLDQPEAARAEYAWRRSQRSWVGFVGSAGGASVPLDDPALRPLWRAMDEDGAFMLLHPGSSPDTRLAPHYLANLLGNPVETAVAAAQLVFGDVLHRYPGVSFLLAHCGGAMPALAGRWQRGFETARPGVGALELPPAEAVRRFWVDALAHEPGVVDLAVRVLGPERIVLGSDWPFPMGIAEVRATIAHLGADLRWSIERENPGRMLGLPR